MSSSGSNSASEAAKNFFSKTSVIYLANFIQNLVIAVVVTAVYTSIMVNNGQTPTKIDLPIDLESMQNFTYLQVRDIIDFNLDLPRGPPWTQMIPDATKSGYPVDTLRKFMDLTGPIDLSYRLEAFDCDDFAYVLLGREREWFGKNSPQSLGGSTFGYVSGDLRLNNETEIMGHAMNIFIDNYSQIWFVEPQTYQIFHYSRLSDDSYIDFIMM
jgi:hypothetical protein